MAIEQLSLEASDDTSRQVLHDVSRLDPRRCDWCGSELRGRRDARFCSRLCRQASWRFGVRRAHQVATARPMTFAYADPPYPGKAGYYPERQEVDHASLVDRLRIEYPDGWALSTSSVALSSVLRLCPPDVRVAAWVKAPRRGISDRPLDAWEPVIVAGGRPLRVAEHRGERVAHDVENALVYRGRYRAFPGAMVGMKPPEFSVWLFRMLGAVPGDELHDLFPGSGAVTEAWRRYVGAAGATGHWGPGDVSAAALRDASPPGAPDASCHAGGTLRLT